MAITPNDVKLLKSERLTDADDGGGRATGTAVVDNEMNNLFPDISRLDRTTGRINLRKVFAGVVTANNDPYLGAHAIVTEPPTDPRVSILLFNTENQTDTRVAAQSAIESYMAPSSTAQFELLGNQLSGQRSITGIQREDQRLPSVGEVYQLVNGATNQYIRVTDVSATIEEFVYAYGAGSWVTFTRRRVVMGISAPLDATFPGGEPTPTGTSANSPTSGQPKSVVLATQVADAARYYGINPVAEAVTEGDLTVKLDSIYAQLVPSTTKETPLLSLLAGATATQIVESGNTTSSAPVFVTTAVTGTSRAFLGMGLARGSLSLTINGGVYGDDKAGNLKFLSGTNWMSSGTIDYETGEITASRSGSAWTGTASATYIPGVVFMNETLTGFTNITLGNRGYVYTLNLAGSLPRPGTLVVSYMALGQWYDIKDKGNGELGGNGTGTVDYATGAVSVTLQALPDIDTALMWVYNSTSDTTLTKHTGAVSSTVKITQTLGTGGVKPTTVSVSWKAGGVAKTATDNGAGIFSGDATGRISYASGELELTLPTAPDTNFPVTFGYQDAALVSETVSGVSTDLAGMATFTIAGAPLEPKSVELQFMVTRKGRVPSTPTIAQSGGASVTSEIVRRVQDDGAGGWKDSAGAVTGTINYTTGECYVQLARLYTYQEYYYRVEFL